MVFKSNSVLYAYYAKQKLQAKKLMFVIGPVGALLIFYWLYNIIGFGAIFLMCLLCCYVAFFMFAYYGTLVLDARYMNRLMDQCSLTEKGWVFSTLPWFAKKEMVIPVTKVIEVKKLDMSFFRGIGAIYKVNFLTDDRIEHVYVSASSYDDFATLLATLEA